MITSDKYAAGSKRLTFEVAMPNSFRTPPRWIDLALDRGPSAPRLDTNQFSPAEVRLEGARVDEAPPAP